MHLPLGQIMPLQKIKCCHLLPAVNVNMCEMLVPKRQSDPQACFQGSPEEDPRGKTTSTTEKTNVLKEKILRMYNNHCIWNSTTFLSSQQSYMMNNLKKRSNVEPLNLSKKESLGP